MEVEKGGESGGGDMGETRRGGAGLGDACAWHYAGPAGSLEQAALGDRLADAAVELCLPVPVPLQPERPGIVFERNKARNAALHRIGRPAARAAQGLASRQKRRAARRTDELIHGRPQIHALERLSALVRRAIFPSATSYTMSQPCSVAGRC